MFGGPTLDVDIWVPRHFTVNASIEGGPLVLEELAGPITARVGSTDVTVRGTEGPVRLISERGTVEVEDVRGDLRVESGRGDVEVVGVRGSLRIETGRGRVDVESVTGPVHVRTQRGRVDIEHVRGDVDVETVRGRVEIEDIEGRVSAVVARADIEIEKVKGVVLARSTRGSIEVEFSGAPLGEIETERGDILVEVPRGAGFDLAAHTARGRIEIGDGEHGWESFDERDFGRWREQWKSRYADDRWEHGWKGIGSWRERARRRFAEHTGESARAGEDPQTRAGVVAEERVEAKGRERSVVRSINGGGQRLSLRTARGSIRIVQ